MKRNYTVSIKSDFSIVIHKHRKSQPPMKFLQVMVGGDVQLLPSVLPETVLAVNEEGQLRGLPRNELATDLWDHRQDGAFLVGNAVLLHQVGDKLLGWSRKSVDTLAAELLKTGEFADEV